jgi:hypothetical protein
MLTRAKPLRHLTLWPQGSSVHQDLSQTPYPIRQPRRHCRRPRLPALSGTRTGHGLELRQGHAQAGVGQHEVMIGMEER